MPNPVHSGPDPDRSGSGVVAGIGAAVLLVICCAAPVLVAAGVLGAVGAWLSNPWVIGAAIALVAAVVLTVLMRHGGARQNRPGDQDPRQTTKEGPHHR